MQPDSGVQVSNSRRFDLKLIVKNRDKKRSCPVCPKQMRFVPVRGTMKKWSPSPYLWKCPNCSAIQLDGSIIPEDETWDKKMLDDEKRRLSSFLSKAMKRKKE